MWIREELVPTCSLETDFPLVKLVAVITLVVGSDVFFVDIVGIVDFVVPSLCLSSSFYFFLIRC